MRIYRIVHDNDGNKHASALWMSYKSAVVSKAQRVNHADDVAIEVADVPEELWRPVDKAAESHAARLNNLMAALAWQDPAGAEQLLQELTERVKHAKGYQQAAASRAAQQQAHDSVLGDRVRREAEEALSRLVDAQ